MLDIENCWPRQSLRQSPRQSPKQSKTESKTQSNTKLDLEYFHQKIIFAKSLKISCLMEKL